MPKSAATNLDIIMGAVDQLARSLTPPSEFLSEDTERRILGIRYAVAHALGCDPFADYAPEHADQPIGLTCDGEPSAGLAQPRPATIRNDWRARDISACPICKSEANTLDFIPDAAGFNCPNHGAFKVAHTVFQDNRAEDAEPAQWEAALAKATTRMPVGGWPVIQTYDFGGD